VKTLEKINPSEIKEWVILISFDEFRNLIFIIFLGNGNHTLFGGNNITNGLNNFIIILLRIKLITN